jgi:hypothetical protein
MVRLALSLHEAHFLAEASLRRSVIVPVLFRAGRYGSSLFHVANPELIMKLNLEKDQEIGEQITNYSVQVAEFVSQRSCCSCHIHTR